MIRTARVEDLEIVYDMLCALEEQQLPCEDFRTIYLRNIADDNTIYLVAQDDDGMVCGYIAVHTQWLLHHTGRVAEIQEMYVRNEARNSGVGKDLLDKSVEWARKQHCVLIEVTANLSRGGAHGFYARHGFQHTHLKLTQPLT